MNELFEISGSCITAYKGTSQSVLDMNCLLENIPDIQLSDALFLDHTELEEVILPDGLKILPERCFAGCTNLRNVHLPTSIEVLCADAFYLCSLLNELLIPEHASEISPSLFGTTISSASSRDKIRIYGIPGSAAEQFAASIGFSFTSLYHDYPVFETSIVFECHNGSFNNPQTKTFKIWVKAESPEPVIIPDCIRGIPVTGLSHMPSHCVQGIIIGKNVKTLPEFGIESVTDLSISPENTTFSKEDGLLYSNSCNRLLAVLHESDQKSTITVRPGTKSINPYALRGRRQLKEIHLPQSITSISFPLTWYNIYRSAYTNMTIFGYPDSAVLKAAESVNCVFVDVTLPEHDQQLSRIFKLVPIVYTTDPYEPPKYSYVSLGYTGTDTDTDVRIPRSIGNGNVTSIRWNTQDGLTVVTDTTN